jgi:hypothetical protein
MRASLLIVVTLLAAGCARVEASRPPVEVEMRSVTLHVTPAIAMHIRHLRGRFVASGADRAPYLDDPRSYSVAIDSGEVAVDIASLNAPST